MTDHDPDDHPPLVLDIGGALRAAHERHHMESEDRAASVDRLLDGLNVEQLIALRYLLNQDSKSAMNNYFDGQVITLLRRVHGVDPVTGLTPIEALERGQSNG